MVAAADIGVASEAAAERFPARFAGRIRSELPRTAWRVATCPATWLVLVAALFYGYLAAVRIHQHVAASFDFGVLFQVVHGWAFHAYPGEPLAQPYMSNEWGDHFSPILALLAPLLWIHDSPTTLAVAQALLICAAGVPVYFAVRRLLGAPAAVFACALYLSCVEVQNAIGFDIHENMFEPLLIAIAIERALAGRWTPAAIAMGLTLLCYEDMGVMVLLFGCWAGWKRKWRHAAALCLLGPAAMFLYTSVIVPAWGHDLPFWTARHFDYQQSLKASSIGQAVAHALEHPRHFVHLLISNQTKRDTWWMLLAPLGFLCLFSPISYLAGTTIALLLVSDNTTHWSWHYHFYLQVAPILIIGAAHGLRNLALLGRLLWRRSGLGARLPEPLGRLRSPRVWQGVAAVLALLGLWTSVATELAPHRRYYVAGWEFANGKIKRSPTLNRQINAMAALIPPGQGVYISNDLGGNTSVLTKDTEYGVPQYANYAFFDITRAWAPQGTVEQLESQGFHVIAQDGTVYVMRR